MADRVLKKTVSCLIEQLYLIEHAGDDVVNPDFAVRMMESAAAEIGSLDPESIAILLGLVSELASLETDPARRKFMYRLAENFGLADRL